MRTFLVVLLGQFVSQLGSQLTRFVIGVWVFQKTGSTTQFSLISFFIFVPQILVLPFAGVLVDRWDRRRVMILADTGAGMTTLALFALVLNEQLTVGWIYALVGLGSVCGAFQNPAFTASTVLLVPKENLTRANGAAELSNSLALMAAPMSAAFLLDVLELSGVILLDVLSFLFAVGILLAVRIPRPVPQAGAEARSWREDVLYGWSYLWRRQALLALLILFAAVNLFLGMVQVALTPLVLSFASARELGVVLSTATAGAVTGGVIVTVWGGPRRGRMRLIFMALAFQGMTLFFGGVRPSVPLVAGVAFTYSFCLPLVLANSQAIWQTKVAPEVQGRVFAIRRLVAYSTLPIAYLAVGPLTDHLLEPWLAPGGLLASSVGNWIGVGAGRGVGLLLIGIGAATLLLLAAGYAYRPLRNLEEELEDAVQ